jgi:P27 family predicted phage terminase small subunit
MGQRRQRTPTALNAARGNPSHRPIRPSLPQPEGVATRPRDLDPVARKEWKRILPHLQPLGLATPLDRALLTVYCQAWSRYLAAEAALRQAESAPTADRGRPSPWVTAVDGAVRQLRYVAQEFGLTPASRAGMKAGVPSAERDELQAFRDAHPTQRPA